jgi:hypothetical protein
MFFLGMVLILIGRLFLKSIPENNKITFSSMANFFSAIIALVTGLCGGLLIDIAENFQFYLLNSYGLVFISIFILSFCNGIVCCFLKEKGSLSVKETAQVLFSTKNLRAYLDVYHFYQTKDPIKKKSILIHIANSDADLATSEIGKILKNPLSNEKREALKSLFLHPRLPLLPEVIREAKDPNALHRIIAIFALGGFEGKETEQTLIDLLDDSDMRVKSTAAKSLARVGNQSEFDKILKLSKEPAINIQEKLDFFIAIYIMDDEGVCLKNVFDDIKMEQNSTFIQTYLSLVAKMLELDPALADIFEKENCQNKSGFSAVLQEAKQLQVFDRDTKLINSLLNHQQYQKIFQWAGEVLKNTDFYGKTHFLKEAILSVEEDKMSKDLSLAVLYFLYQMLLASE